MKIPVTPPNIIEEKTRWGKKTTEYLQLIFTSNIGPYDYKGRYVHWEKLRHLPVPKNMTSKLHWFAMKSARKQISKELVFVDKSDAPFEYSIPDGVMRDILWISENATGAIEADMSISDDKTKKTYLINSLIEEAISSSQLEGATTTRRIAKELIRTGRKPKDHSETMILNNYHAMSFIRDNRDDELTPSMIFELHRILTEGTLSSSNINKAGVLRTESDNIAVYSQSNVLLHTPPHASQLELRLKNLCDFANRTTNDEKDYIPPIIKAILLHFMIGYDHPFTDGNGRTARALFYWMMAKNKYWLMEYISISRVIKKAPIEYGNAFLYTETDGNDTTYFLIHQLKVIKQAVQELHLHLINKSKQRKDVKLILEKSSLRGLLNHRQLSIIKNALNNPGAEYTIKSHQTSHGVAYQTARTDLLKLSDDFQLLKKYKVGKKDEFVAPQNIKDRILSFKNN